MTDSGHHGSEQVEGFLTGLSSVNFVFAFAMNMFNFTVLVLLRNAGMPILYGGIGISIGQFVLIFAVIPLGRLIDRGKAYMLMSVGSVAYALALIALYITTSGTSYYLLVSVTAAIAGVLIFQNMFKSSLSSFIAKAVKAKLMGKSYSRIFWMESAGGTASFFLILFGYSDSTLRAVYLLTGIILLVTSLASFLVIATESRESLRLRANRLRRPSFRESVSTLRQRGRFTMALLASKVFVSIGFLGFSYFYLLIARIAGTSLYLALISLGASSALGILWGMYAERFIGRHPQWGKIYIVLIAVLDLVSYLLIFVAMQDQNSILYLAAPIIGSPGPFLIPGALSYEVRVVGRENRGVFSGIQRTLTGIPAILLGAPLTYVFTIDPTGMWAIILAASAGTVATSLLIPSGRELEKIENLPDTSPS